MTDIIKTMSEYKQVKIGKLKLKGSTVSKPKKNKKKRKNEEPVSDIPADDDAKDHGGWWSIQTFEHITGCTVALQMYNSAYIFAVDNGTLQLGVKHGDTDNGPEQEEMFSMIRITDNKIALKSGYGKYVSVNARGEILARSEAVGPQEQLEVVIQDKKVALQGHNGYFVTVTDDNELKSICRTAKEREIICLRTNMSRSKKKKASDEEEVGDVRQFEINYVKQFQSFGDHRLKLHDGPTSNLEKAKSAGKLHEAMLDRREKMKADRYCK
ncbi:protein FRG1-like [Hydractinia symbiolongicarpus]|uniref:protein FRG1-like n=1 Tax=Hydractinia symbiolongicarpus TaxID=13093 RepID=UPI002549EF66|nr:protein FRG1-like [Hydractinia symbiolongicarpus]